ncbi:MAG: dihydrolipoamide acetyltransferase family protein, partial [Burkholderiales bacterium]
MIEFKLPSLGADMDEGKLLEWKVKPGDQIKRGDIVAVVDTTKAAIDVESWVEGTVNELIVQPGTTVPVGSVLATLLPPGESERATKPKPEAAAPAAAISATPPHAAETKPVSAPAQKLAPEPTAATAQRRKISPAARKRAAELGVDIEALAGSGPDGGVTLADVERAAQPAAEPAIKPTQAAGAAKDRAAEMRKTIAAAMTRAKREIPHYYVGETVPLAAASQWLATYNAKRSVTERVLMAVLLLKAVAVATKKYPELNGLYRDGRFEASPAAHIGVAISLRGGGLIAPAIHDVDRKAPDELMRALSDLVQRARGGSLKSSEIADATITVTNLGDQGVEEVYGVIYPPQVALVGFGRMSEQVIADNDAIRILPAVRASLSADHRVSDGHRGALFLAYIRNLLQ